MNIHQLRRQRLCELLPPSSIVLLHSGSAPHQSFDEFYPYYPDMNFYYLTGIDRDNVILCLIKEDKDTKEFLFIPETTDYMRLWLGAHISATEAEQTSGIETVLFTNQFEGFFHNVMHFTRRSDIKTPEYLYVDLFSLRPDMIPKSHTQFAKQLNEYKNLSVRNVNEHLYALRMIKDEVEVANLKEAIRITGEGLKRLMKDIPNRTNEGQLEADFLHQIRLEGAKHVSFQTISASGKNATVLHYEDNDATLDRNDLILFDLGAKHRYYSADITRTYPLSGTFTKRQRDIYEVVLEANKTAIARLKPGLTWSELNKIADKVLTEGAIRLGILKEGEPLQKYYYHSIGHLLGLDTHDVGVYTKPLAPGMVLTIEPGLYVKDEGIGVRIEDNVLITDDGCVNLSEAIAKDVDAIEELMKQSG